MTFDPLSRLIKIQGGAQYLQVKHRMMWMRDEVEGQKEIQTTTEMLYLDWAEGVAVIKVGITVPGRGSAEGIGSETRKGFPAGFLEKAETIALGRALAKLGYGTEYALEFDEGDRLADTPIPVAPRPTAASSGASEAQRSPRNGAGSSGGTDTHSKPPKPAAATSGAATASKGPSRTEQARAALPAPDKLALGEARKKVEALAAEAGLPLAGMGWSKWQEVARFVGFDGLPYKAENITLDDLRGFYKAIQTHAGPADGRGAPAATTDSDSDSATENRLSHGPRPAKNRSRSGLLS